MTIAEQAKQSREKPPLCNGADRQLLAEAVKTPAAEPVRSYQSGGIMLASLPSARSGDLRLDLADLFGPIWAAKDHAPALH